ncbi:hypothetical protein, partial [Nocardia sp. NPDC019302]|uniref:hypothetical protein n=1 Tax=Nocardia sp. NPDC019302 TaxID=3154592 RepID=UPI0033EC5CCC
MIRGTGDDPHRLRYHYFPAAKRFGRRRPCDALAARELERVARRGRGRFAVGASEGDADQTVDEH